MHLENRGELQEQATQGMHAIYQLKDELLTNISNGFSKKHYYMI